jgi:2-dehydro-3-deoxygalactonokinase
MAGARLLAVDWGSTRLRAYLLGANGEVLDTRSSEAGASTLGAGAGGFEAALQAVAGDWLHEHPGLPAVACGMVGSAHGWREAPYAECPIELAGLHAHAVSVPWAGGELKILPGMSCREADGTPDVMRGEETQIAGVLARRPQEAAEAMLVLPGTHSKWARLQGGRVMAFATRMTGELYAVLRQHSVLGRLMTGTAREAFDNIAFDKGIAAAQRSGGRDLAHQLFATRTLGLFGHCPSDDLGDFLSGLLIGHELVAGLQQADPRRPLILVGEPALCARYQRGLQQLGREDVSHIDHTAPAGLWQQALLAGWVH